MSYIKLRDGIRGRVPKWGEVCPCGEGACLAPRYARLSWHYTSFIGATYRRLS